METKNKVFDVKDFINRLKRFTGCESDQELSRYFDFPNVNQIATYKHRDKISTTGLHQILSKLNGRCNLNWLFYGRGDAEAVEKENKFYSDLLLQMIDALGIDIDGPEARTINNQFLQLISETEIDEEQRRAEINRFLGTLFNYMITRTNDQN